MYTHHTCRVVSHIVCVHIMIIQPNETATKLFGKRKNKQKIACKEYPLPSRFQCASSICCYIHATTSCLSVTSHVPMWYIILPCPHHTLFSHVVHYSPIIIFLPIIPYSPNIIFLCLMSNGDSPNAKGACPPYSPGISLIRNNRSILFKPSLALVVT